MQIPRRRLITLCLLCLLLGSCGREYELDDDTIYPWQSWQGMGSSVVYDALEDAVVDEPSAWVYLRLAQWAIHNQQWAVAERYCANALEIDSTHAWAWYLRGSAFAALEEWEEALAAFRQAYHYGYASAFLYLQMGRAALALGDSAECLKAMAEAQHRLPFHFDTHYWAGRAYLSFGQPAYAVAAFTKALEYEPVYASTFYFLLKSLESQGLSEKADSVLAFALDRLPHSDTLWYYHAQRSWQRAQVIQARASYEHALRINSNYHVARYQLAQLLIRQGLWEAACEHMQELERRAWRQERVYFWLARCALRRQEVQKAIDYLEKQLNLQPEDSEARGYLFYARSLRDGTWQLIQSDSLIEPAGKNSEGSSGLRRAPMPAELPAVRLPRHDSL